MESAALAIGQGGAQAVSAGGHDPVLRHPGSGDPLQVRTRMGDYHMTMLTVTGRIHFPTPMGSDFDE